MMYEIVPQRKMTSDSTGSRYEKCEDACADVFTLYGFEQGHKRDERVIKRFIHKKSAERHANKLCRRPENILNQE